MTYGSPEFILASDDVAINIPAGTETFFLIQMLHEQYRVLCMSSSQSDIQTLNIAMEILRDLFERRQLMKTLAATGEWP